MLIERWKPRPLAFSLYLCGVSIPSPCSCQINSRFSDLLKYSPQTTDKWVSSFLWLAWFCTAIFQSMWMQLASDCLWWSTNLFMLFLCPLPCTAWKSLKHTTPRQIIPEPRGSDSEDYQMLPVGTKHQRKADQENWSCTVPPPLETMYTKIWNCQRWLALDLNKGVIYRKPL